MSRKARSRKQRVVLRAKHKSELKQHIQTGLSGLVAVGLVSVVVIFSFVRKEGWLPQFIHRHSPMLEYQTPEVLAELPLLKDNRPSGFLLWFPGSAWRMRRQWMQQYPAIGDVKFVKHFKDNRIVAQIEPRVPLVRLENGGLDKEGIVFPLMSARWATLPKAVSLQTQSLPRVGQWLVELTHTPEVWSQVVAVTQDPRGDMWLDMQTGTHIAWGPMDVKTAREKARCLATVLDDAHHRLSGASTADLRFFEEGRVIVRPKSAV